MTPTSTVGEQTARFERLLLRNETLVTILEMLPTLALPDCFLAGGAVFQTVLNGLTGQPAEAGIRDYDINYFDSFDLSWDGEDAVINRASELFADLPADVEVRNEARVHLWYEEKFGVPCPAYENTAAAIATFPATNSCFGVRRGADRLEICAPFGFDDLFALRARPNPVLAPRQVYETKTSRWKQQWPELTVMSWDSTD